MTLNIKRQTIQKPKPQRNLEAREQVDGEEQTAGTAAKAASGI